MIDIIVVGIITCAMFLGLILFSKTKKGKELFGE